MAITYKSVIANAITNFNEVQNALSSKGVPSLENTGKIIDSSSVNSNASLEATSSFGAYISNNLGLISNDPLTPSFGTASGGFYTLNAYENLTGTTVSGTSVTYNKYHTTVKVAAGSFGTDGNGNYVVTGAGYVPKQTLLNKVTYTPTGAGTISGKNTLTINTTDSSSVGGVNLSSILTELSDTSEPTSGNFISFKAKSSGTGKAASVTPSGAGYNSTTGAITAGTISYSAADVTKYYSVRSASLADDGTFTTGYVGTKGTLDVNIKTALSGAASSVAPGSVTAAKDTTSAISAGTNITSNEKITVSTADPVAGSYYVLIKPNAAEGAASDKTVSGTVNAKVTQAGYVNTKTVSGDKAVSGTVSVKASAKTGSTHYVKLPGVSGSIGGTPTSGSATANITNIGYATYNASGAGTPSETDIMTVLTTKPNSGGYYEVKATATGNAGKYTPSYTVNGAGWMAGTVTGSAQTVNVNSDTTGKSVWIKKATVAGSVTGNAPTISVSGTTITASSSDKGSVSVVTAAGYTGTASTTVKGVSKTATLGVTKSSLGYGETATVTVDGKNSSVTVTNGIGAGSLATAESAEATGTNGAYKSYTDLSGENFIIPSEGYLILNAGYYSNSKISLDSLLGGLADTDIQVPTAAYIRENYVAYDVNGKKLTGTMKNVTPAFDGGGLSLSNTSSNADGTNVSISDTDTDPGTGIKIVTGGSAKITRGDVLYNGAKTGYLSVADNTVALAGTTTAASSISANTYYITALTLPSGKTLGTSSSAGITNNGTVYLTNTGTLTISTNGTADVISIDGTTVTSSGKLKTGSVAASTIKITDQTAPANRSTSGDMGVAVCNDTAKNYVTVAATATPGTITTGWVSSTTHTINGDTARIPAVSSYSISAKGSASGSATVGGAAGATPTCSTFASDTGAVTKSAKSATGSISGTVSGSSTTKDVYVTTGGSVSNGGITGTATAKLSDDATGSVVDDYLESLYKRMLGQSYTARDAD